MSLYGEYILEREGKQIVEDDRGFATYVITDNVCYIESIYVRRDFRMTNVASYLADKIVVEAKERGCTVLLGSVDPLAHGSTISTKVLFGYGFELSHISGALIYFKKELV